MNCARVSQLVAKAVTTTKRVSGGVPGNMSSMTVGLTVKSRLPAMPALTRTPDREKLINAFPSLKPTVDHVTEGGLSFMSMSSPMDQATFHVDVRL